MYTIVSVRPLENERAAPGPHSCLGPAWHREVVLSCRGLGQKKGVLTGTTISFLDAQLMLL